MNYCRRPSHVVALTTGTLNNNNVPFFAINSLLTYANKLPFSNHIDTMECFLKPRIARHVVFFACFNKIYCCYI